MNKKNIIPNSKYVLALTIILGIFVAGCTNQYNSALDSKSKENFINTADNPDTKNKINMESKGDNMTKNITNTTIETATFAGGCFWCMESGLEDKPGVIDVVSGYTGGKTKNPTYEDVSTGSTGHFEAVEVKFNPEIITYEELLQSFWILINPTDPNGQFADKGTQYQTAIFYHNEEQRIIAERSKSEIAKKFDKPIATKILPASVFYRAEEYHQDYAKKQASSFQRYEKASGRADFIEENIKRYAKPTSEELKEILTPLQYRVTQEEDTEQPFNNLYWDNKREGIYVDIVSGEPLFSSTDKYDSGTGWPSFSRPLVAENIVEKKDYSLIFPRTEARSKQADSHLGHIFDGESSPTGIRYCMNSASLRFIPKENLEKEGYGEFINLFNEGNNNESN